MNYTSIRIEGGLLSPDFFESIHSAPGQQPVDFGLDKRQSLVDELSTIWSDVRTYWNAFQRRLARAQQSDRESITSITRQQWVMPLLEALGYQLTFQRATPRIDGQSYPIEYWAGPAQDAPPVHIVAFDQPLGSRSRLSQAGAAVTGQSATRLSPHALLQEYLNRSEHEHLWGIVTNGAVLRLLRDSTYFSRPAYIEFDLQQMVENERFDEFILFYRLVQRSRLPRRSAEAGGCWLEQYHQGAVEQGGRIRDGLRDAVRAAILTLGNGFLHHRKNEALRSRLTSEQLTVAEFYRQLLYLIYRLLFLMVAEERKLLDDAPAAEADRRHSARRREEHYRFFSLERLRRLADEPLSAPERFDDLYLGLCTLFAALRDEALASQLGVTALNGELFAQLTALEQDEQRRQSYLDNRHTLKTMQLLAHFTPIDERVRRRVNYGALDVEELGSVYESLLDEHPVIERRGGRLHFDLVAGSERKSTGSYYTPHSLVKELIDSTLVPVMQARLQAAGPARAAREAALLDLRICDPSCGSGHFLLAAARRMGLELARVRANGDEPPPEAVREATRTVISQCIYGVDKNPLAVDLCKVALWIEGHVPGKALTFLDHAIRCGDSLVGVLDTQALDSGIPDNAFTAMTGDDSKAANELKRRNRQERLGQLTFDEARSNRSQSQHDWQRFLALPDATVPQVRHKRETFERLRRNGSQWWQQQSACHLWTAAFFAKLSGDPADLNTIPTSADLRDYRRYGGNIDGRKVGQAWTLAGRHNFFHWPLEFKEVFDRGGFDVVLGNPPWERIKLQEKEWFANRDPAIANAPNAAARHQRIEALLKEDPTLHAAFLADKRAAECGSHFVRNSGRYPLCGRGDVNTYTIFAELARQLINDRGRVGIIVPTGIATDDTTKYFFQSLMDNRSLVSLYDFENRQKIFSAVDSRMKFCLLTLRGTTPSPDPGEGRGGGGAEFIFFAQDVAELKEEQRRFTLSAAEIALLNPNTRTCPIFRSKRDAELTKAIYQRVPVLIKEGEAEENPWGVSFLRMLDMSNDSDLFRTREQLERAGWRLQAGAHGAQFVREHEVYLPLYEAKMLHHFDHRWATYDGLETRDLAVDEKSNPKCVVLPRYWVDSREVQSRLRNYGAGWLVAFRDIARSTDERTAIFSIIPKVGVGNKAPLLLSSEYPFEMLHLAGCAASFVFDYVARQCIGGITMNFFIVKQLAFLPPTVYSQPCPWAGHAPRITHHAWLLPRVLELTYTAWDLQPFARDCGYDGPPFRWDEERRFLLRCEVDAAYFHLYGIARDDVAYILETFPIVKRKDKERYGCYRTQQVILALYDAMTQAMTTGVAYQTPLDPPPADVRVAHGGAAKLNASNAITVYNISQPSPVNAQEEALSRIIYTKR